MKKLWEAAEKAGDPLAAILVADQLFSELTGGRKPGPGTFAFRGGIPVADIEVVQQWYRQALERDARSQHEGARQTGAVGPGELQGRPGSDETLEEVAGAPSTRMADGVGFEPTVGFHPRRFSRPLP